MGETADWTARHVKAGQDRGGFIGGLEQVGAAAVAIPMLWGSHFADESPYSCNGWQLPFGGRDIRESVDEEEYQRKREAAQAAQENKQAMSEYKTDVKIWRDKHGLPDDAAIYQAEADGVSPHVETDESGNPQCVPVEDASGTTKYSPYSGGYDNADLDPNSPVNPNFVNTD